MILVATKSDIKKSVSIQQQKQQRNFFVSTKEGLDLAKAFNCPFIESSSKNNENVNQVN